MLITSLAAVAFNPSGSKLATASERGTFLPLIIIITIKYQSSSLSGTVIRVFNVTDGTRLLEFRRGVKR